MKRFVVVGLGFGDEGKGTVTDYLVREHQAEAVVRYSGGAQCGHRVELPDGRSHVFAQFGSGTFVPGVETYLSKHVLVNPLNLWREDEHLRQLGVDDALDRLYVDGGAVIVTPFHVAANRVQEIARGTGRHGSCGQGIGDARSDDLNGWFPVVRAADLFFDDTLLAKLRQLQRVKLDFAEWQLGEVDPDTDVGGRLFRMFEEMKPLFDPSVPEQLVDAYGGLRGRVVNDVGNYVRLYETVVFEGAQGILLDETHGFYPHVTWTDTTSAKAHEILDASGYTGERTTVGVTRCYMTRHGAGPLPTEDAELTRLLVDAGNRDDPWQGSFRVGEIDTDLLKLALVADGRVDEVAMTCLDRLPFDHLLDEMEVTLGLPIALRSYGPTFADKRRR